VRRRSSAQRLSRLSLQYDIVDGGPDWPVVSILIDGRSPFEAIAPGWRGFDPSDMLGPGSPLLPNDRERRVALYRCTCGVAGCGVIAATIERSPDGRRISWTDFRDHVGVFDGPLASAPAAPEKGRPWPLADFHFDRAQYESEVRRLTADASWETPRRRTARRVQERLAERGLLAAAAELNLQWVAPAWKREGVELYFEQLGDGPSPTEQLLLHVVSRHDDADDAAAEIVEKLAKVDPRDWSRSFG
jgi:hypothetical protein